MLKKTIASKYFGNKKKTKRYGLQVQSFHLEEVCNEVHHQYLDNLQKKSQNRIRNSLMVQWKHKAQIISTWGINTENSQMS